MKKITIPELIRILSAMFTPEQAVDRLALVNLLIRGYLGDAEIDFVNEQIQPLGFEVQLSNQVEQLRLEIAEHKEMCETFASYVKQANERVKHLEKLYSEAKSKEEVL